MASLKRVMLIIRNGGVWDRGLIAGVSSFTHPWHPWAWRVAFPTKETLRGIPKWAPDGFLGRFPNREAANRFRQFGKPIVNISPLPGIGLPRVGADNTVIGEIAAEHLCKRNYTSFGFVGFKSLSYSQFRRDGFAKAIRKRKGHFAHLDVSIANPMESTSGLRPAERAKLADWLKRLPRPVAVFACDDCCGLEVLEACRIAGLAVPQEVAVLAADNDESLCVVSKPSLSSVELPAQRVGFLAAELLDRLLGGLKAPRRAITVQPTRVVDRQSTDFVAVDDPLVASALGYIRANAASRINVEDVVRQQEASRRGLEQRFRKTLGHSILQEIHTARLERCRELLSETELPIAEVARLSGFRDSRHLDRTFAQKVGTSPSAYRERTRRGHEATA